jgi:AraC family transcriptional regulator
MNPSQRALWYIESHFAGDITLEDIATSAGVSRFHLSRAFAAATGLSILRYVRGRRLTEAARTLAGGAPDILAVALVSGYGSHEAFTRAFRDRFGLTPESVREQRHLGNLDLMEPIKMEETLVVDLEPPRFETPQPLFIAGLCERYTCESSAAIPAQWQRFLPHLGNVPGQVGQVAYGVNFNPDDEGNFDYLCGVQVPDFSKLPRDWGRVRIPQHRYAVFLHRGHISGIRNTHSTIWNHWLPASGHKVADAPIFERYDESFDSRTGLGGVQIWIPLVC